MVSCISYVTNVEEDLRKLSEEISEYSKQAMYKFTEGYNGTENRCSCGGRANCFITGKGWICIKCFEEETKK